MSVGLHAYGFRSGMAFWLSVFVLSQLAVMAVGCWTEEKDSTELAKEASE